MTTPKPPDEPTAPVPPADPEPATQSRVDPSPPVLQPGYPAAYPFAPRVREPWINPAKRATAGLIGAAAAVVLLGGGFLIGAATSSNGHHGNDGSQRDGRGGYGQQLRGRGEGLPGQRGLPGRPRLPGGGQGPGRIAPTTGVPTGANTPSGTPS